MGLLLLELQSVTMGQCARMKLALLPFISRRLWMVLVLVCCSYCYWVSIVTHLLFKIQHSILGTGHFLHTQVRKVCSANLYSCIGDCVTRSQNRSYHTRTFQLISSFCMWKLGFHPRAVHVGFVVDKIALRQVLLRVILFFPVFSTVICFTHDQ
jgi:hypothetical protein